MKKAKMGEKRRGTPDHKNPSSANQGDSPIPHQPSFNIGFVSLMLILWSSQHIVGVHWVLDSFYSWPLEGSISDTNWAESYVISISVEPYKTAVSVTLKGLIINDFLWFVPTLHIYVLHVLVDKTIYFWHVACCFDICSMLLWYMHRFYGIANSG